MINTYYKIKKKILQLIGQLLSDRVVINLVRGRWNNKAILIRDYPYTPMARNSFTPVIKSILDRDYQKNEQQYINLAQKIVSYAEFYENIPVEGDYTGIEPHWINCWIPPIDGATIYTFLAENNPRYYVECGSGTSTKFAYKAIRDHGLKTKIISIDPQPRAEINDICDKIYRLPLEKMSLSFFAELTEEDILLLDCSHRAFANSDVTVFFTEILPQLPSGLIYALHDIALPYEHFPERFYNEQYMLAVYIIAGMMGDTFYFPTSYINQCTDIPSIFEKITFSEKVHFKAKAGFFWLRKS